MMSSTGIAMEVHYCMGQKAGVDFFKVENEKCKKCGMTEKKGGCCNDEHKFYKLNSECKNASPYLLSPSFNVDAILVQTKDFYFLQIPANGLKVVSGGYPPDKNSPRIYILNCVFRI